MDPFKQALLDAALERIKVMYYDPKVPEHIREAIMRHVDQAKDIDPEFHAELLRQLADADPCKDKVREASAEEETRKALAKMMGKVWNN